MSNNKLVKTVIDAATLTLLAAGIGWAAKKVVKENFTTTRPLLNVSTALWLSVYSTTSTPWKCDSLRASGPLPG